MTPTEDRPRETPDATPELFSASQLAAAIGRSPWGVKLAIKRLGIRPTAITGGRVKLYPPSLAEALEEGMRAPNGESDKEG